MIDRDAVDALGHEVVDWRFKGLPVGAEGGTVDEVAARGLNLFDDGFLGPVLTLDEGALEHNIQTMAAWCAERDVLLAPHAKTTMAPQLWARQLAAGAWGLTAANAAQLRVYRRFGVSRVLFANELVDAPALHWVADELDRDERFEFSCFADSPEVVRRMTGALAARPPTRPVDVLVEIGRTGGRAGARTLDDALATAKEIAASPLLRLVGVAGYEGVLVNDPSPHSLAVVDEFVERLRLLTTRLHEDGMFEAESVIVSAGGSCFFDQVAAGLTRPWADGLAVLPILRSGCYVAHDDGFYRWMSPFSRTEPGGFRPALRAWARVTSRPEPGLALLTAGKRDLSFDAWMPEPQLIRRDGGEVLALRDCVLKEINDQHAFIRLGPDADPRVGDWVGLGLAYPCTAFDKWQLIPVLRGETVVDFVRTFF
ncbi:amino acid deaminase [Actinokineospora sp. NBRC 105648]|uniref:amino acid deaminase n=1 Tax=Actinokineospora sp. NBRC 105648 TaxID=3032206 RepID=UPI0024A34588|nr:amino acid deaminase [Actinokineospora sp. NBRC 105648]GLZ38101.1 amino acid deaminase [Actinokineospora sp. NBRC 105648]